MGEFFDTRMKQLGVDESNNQVKLFNPEAEHPMPRWSTAPIFTEVGEEGDIEINYWSLDRQAIVYYNDNKTPMPRFYKVLRLAKPRGDNKYRMPAGQGTHPWFHPTLCDAYEAGSPIPVLYLTEGVFKAWKACQCGIPVVALSITHYRGDNKELHADIQRLIERCQVQHLVVLWDGDCLNISPKAVPVREELTKRPAGFYNAVKNIRELAGKIKLDDRTLEVHFMHVKSESFSTKPKGLDDILITAEQTEKKRLDAVISDAFNIEKSGEFFFKMNITQNTVRLREYFALHDPDTFYKRHADVIGDAEFFFHGDMLFYDRDKETVRMIAPEWAKDVRWIGDEFFVERVVPAARGTRKQLLKRTKETMRDLHGKGFMGHLSHFDGFCNVPDHFNYQQVVEVEGKRFYNRYFAFKHVPEEGPVDKILEFIKHIFGTQQVPHAITGTKIPSWELGLDYLQLLITEPMQALPVVCLYSPENNTGKSTFGKLLAYLFGDNCVQIGNSDLQSDFNEVYTDKLLAICEETLLERKKDVERIKALSTSDQITVNPKGQRQFTIDFFCKFQFYSNNRRMIYVTKHDERFWIIRVHKSSVDNPNLLAEMKDQVPAFLAFLRGRELATKRESRMHFHPSLIRTETFEEVVEVNEPHDATDLREQIAEWFMQMPTIHTIEMPLQNIISEFFKPATSARWIQEILRDYLNVDLKRDQDNVAIFERGSYTKMVWSENSADFVHTKVQWRGRPYLFKRDQFVKDNEVHRVGDDEPIQPWQPDPADIGTLKAQAAALAINSNDLPF